MVDETALGPVDELDEFARSFATDEPETPPAAPAAPAPTEEPKPEPKKPPVEQEKPAEEVKPPVKEDENPFKTDEKEQEKPAEEEKEPKKPSSSDDWSRLRESRNKYKAAAEEKETMLREREAEITELKAKAARVAELEDKLKRFDEQEKRLAIADVKSTVEYEQVIEAPLIAIREQVEILVKANEGDVESVLRMLTEANPAKQRAALKEITSGWDEIDRIDLKKMAEDARVILDKEDAMLKNAHAAAKEQKELASRREAETKEAFRKDFLKMTGEAVKSIRKKLPFVPLVEGETEDDRYTLLEQKVSAVDFDAQTPRAKALAVASTLALPKAIQTIAAKETEITSLKEALKKATEGKPSITPSAEPKPDAEEKDFFDEFGIPDRSKMFGSMGLDVQAG